LINLKDGKGFLRDSVYLKVEIALDLRIIVGVLLSPRWLCNVGSYLFKNLFDHPIRYTHCFEQFLRIESIPSIAISAKEPWVLNAV